MLRDVAGFHRRERADTDMQRDPDDIRNAAENLRREMQARGGSGDRAGLVRIDRLVGLAIAFGGAAAAAASAARIVSRSRSRR